MFVCPQRTYTSLVVHLLFHQTCIVKNTVESACVELRVMHGHPEELTSLKDPQSENKQTNFVFTHIDWSRLLNKCIYGWSL